MARQTRYTFTVSSTGRFPLDMLRYDCAWPKAPLDVMMVGATIKGRKGRADIMLQSNKRPTAGRWASFGWTITRVDEESAA